MKKIIIVLALVFVASVLFADCWTDYKAARESAKTAELSGDYATASAAWLTVEVAALALTYSDGTPATNAQEIADWDRNNAGYMLILDFNKTRNADDLKQALVILQARKITTVAATKVQKNIDYCNQQLADIK
jgi:hypothetical protein